MFETLTERSPEEARRDEDTKTLNEKMLKVNEEQKGLLDKRMKQAVEQMREEALERAKVRAWRNPFATAIEYYSEIGSK